MKACRVVFLIALVLAAWQRAARAADVTVGIVVRQEGGDKPLDAAQDAWRSPIGGWVVATAPFGLRVADRPFLDFLSAADKIAAASATGANDEEADAVLADLEDDDARKQPADPKTFRFDRPASALVAVGEGKRSITPFGIAFEVGEDGVPKSGDPRLEIDAARRQIDLICHPVTIRTVAGGRTATAPLDVAVAGRGLLGGLVNVLAEHERLAEPWRKPEAKDQPPAFTQLTLFLPATTSAAPYELAGRKFTVADDGKVTLDAAAQGAKVEGQAILLEATGPAAPAVAATRPVAVQWWNLADTARIVTGAGAAVEAAAGESAAVVAVPTAGPGKIVVGGLSVTLPAASQEWPHANLLWDAGGQAAWSVESAGLWARPAAEWRCRIVPLAGKAASFGRELPVRVEPVASAAGETRPGAATTLSAGDGGVFVGQLPKAVGLHRIVAAGNGPLAGRTLGHAWLAEQEPVAAVSIFTVNNRGLFRRGDTIDVCHAISGTPPKGDVQLVLRGMGIEKPLGAAAGQSGGIRLDTALLAPGRYEITAAAPADLAVYPLSFRICQREPRSSYEIYSYVYGPARPMAGSPVSGYYYGVRTGEPGLAPFLADVTAAIAPTLGAYASAPIGPAVEKCRPLPKDEAAQLAVTLLGGRGVPTPPQMLHHEEWNPKHTLPEELAEMRRRLALFTQPRADVAGFGGFALNWYASVNGYWEESPPLDGHQKRRNAAAAKWIAERVEKRVAEARKAGLDAKQIEWVQSQAGREASSAVLPAAYAEYLADALAIRPDLTSHTGVPSFWLGKHSFPPAAYMSLSHRDSVDYTDYGVSPWGNFRVPTFLGMGNPAGQQSRCSFMTIGRDSRIATAFAAAGRGLDGLSLTLADEHPTGEDAALLAILSRFGPFFSALEPLPDVAVYFSGWGEQASVIIHDLARMRRPGVLLTDDDVRAGKLAGAKVLFLAAIGAGVPADIVAAFEKFAADGGTIVKDGFCDAGLPGRPLGFNYDEEHVHKGWGLGGPDGEWEFAALWHKFKEVREARLVEAFKAARPAPVSTPTPDVVLAPLAGSESILCFSVNQTLVPLEVPGKWRQHAVLPCTSTLLVADGWHVHDLLAGRAVPVADTPAGRGVPLDFTRCVGAIHLLTRRRPESLAIRTERTAPGTVQLAAWLADGTAAPLPDPLPFEVTLRSPDHGTLFHAFVAASPTRTVDVPVPALAADASLELVVRDLVLGCTATEKLEPAAAAAITADSDTDLVGGRDAIAAFCASRTGPVTILLDEGQESLRPAAAAMAKLLSAKGRETKIVGLDPAHVRPLPLRWVPRPEDEPGIEAVRSGGLAWRIDLGAVRDKSGESVVFDDPRCGYAEYGPRLACDTDIVLFGLPATHRVIDDLAKHLRRRPTESLPAEDGFFVEHLRSPFRGGRDGILIACRDAAGAQAAVARLATLAPTPPAPKAGGAKSRGMETKGGAPAPLEDLVAGRFGTPILDAAFAPDGRLIVTADSYGDSLFVVDPTGKVLDSRPLGNRIGNSNWSRAGGVLSDVAGDGFGITFGGTPCRYDLSGGWVGRTELPPHGFAGSFKVPIAAATMLADPAQGRTFVGGSRRMRCLDASGKLLWSYDDATARTEVNDLLYPRCVFPRGVTPDGRQLLVAGFGIQTDCYNIGKAVNASILGLDAATGKLLWQQDGVLLNEGKAIPLDGRFLVIDDAGAGRLLGAADGRPAGSLGEVAGSDWVVPVPKSKAVLIVENKTFDRQGRAARAYLRPLSGGGDQPLAVAGRVVDLAVAADGTITFVTERGLTQHFASDGTLLWQASTPTGGVVRPSGDGARIAIGARDGIVHMLDARDGKSQWTLDVNPSNVTTGRRFVEQLGIGDMPVDASRTPPSDPPEPSWLAVSPAKGVKIGKPLVDRKGVAAGRSVSFAVEKGKTYLVETLAAAAPGSAAAQPAGEKKAGLTPLTRLEIAVDGVKADQAAAFRARLPLSGQAARRRVAFRAERSGTATLTVRAVEPPYAKPVASGVPVAIEDAVVAELVFPGRNVLFDGGPKAASRPLGDVTCTVKPWTGGNSTLRWQPYPCPAASLRLVNGTFEEPDAVWTKEARAEGIHSAEAIVKLVRPQVVSAVVIHEDTSGPVPSGNAAFETVSPRFAVYAKEAESGRWRSLGVRFDNASLVNVFAGPDAPVSEILYVWAGRDATTIDGFVRPTELEVYAGDDLDTLLDEPLEVTDDVGL